MPTLLPWTSVEIGDLDVFAPALPSLVVYTWYVDGEPESTVTYFWQDEDTGMVHHELLFMEPVTRRGEAGTGQGGRSGPQGRAIIRLTGDAGIYRPSAHGMTSS